MSQAEVDVVQNAYAALRRGGFEAVLEFIHPDFEAEAPPDLSVEPQTYRGREGVRYWFESFYEAVDEVRLEPEEFIDRGTRVVVPVSLVVRGRDSGIEAAQQLVQVWTIKDGKAIAMQAYADKESALRALDREPTV
jgi:ketosteroid isomerase-like protein